MIETTNKQTAKAAEIVLSAMQKMHEVMHTDRINVDTKVNCANAIAKLAASLDMLEGDNGRIVTKFCAELVDMQDRAIVNAVIRAAEDEKITQLLLLDKRFVLDAIREKIERMRWG